MFKDKRIGYVFYWEDKHAQISVPVYEDAEREFRRTHPEVNLDDVYDVDEIKILGLPKRIRLAIGRWWLSVTVK